MISLLTTLPFQLLIALSLGLSTSLDRCPNHRHLFFFLPTPREPLPNALAEFTIAFCDTVVDCQVVFHFREFETERLPAHANLPGRNINCDLFPFFGGFIKRFISDGDSQKSQTGLITTVDERERTSDDSLNSGTCE